MGNKTMSVSNRKVIAYFNHALVKMMITNSKKR